MTSVCQGSAVFIINLLPSKGCSKYGKAYFIGCSAWKYTERDKHRYLPIPLNVDEDILTNVMANDGVLPSNIASNLNATCVLAVHPRVALKACREYQIGIMFNLYIS
jgi:hypothetical protein